MSRLKKAFSYVTGLNQETQYLLDTIQAATNKEERKQIEARVRAGTTTLTPKTLEVNGDAYIYAHVSDEKELNKQLQEVATKESFSSFAKNAHEEITHLIAPNILGLEAVKEAAALQLFAKERMHVLLLGDPGTGKTDILRSTQELATISSMGLGSGTSGAGLSLAYSKGELQKGLLPLAHGGICLIDELNLMKKDDRAALYNAMEKGFVTYDKASHHEQIPADVRVLATANPKGDRFEGETTQELKQQLPFEPALLSRFHLVFLVRKPDKKAFMDITKKIVKGDKTTTPDTSYAKKYIKHAQQLEVNFPANLEPQVSSAVERIKEQENNLLIEVSPRLVKGIIGFAKASARAQLRTNANRHDVDKAIQLLNKSLELSS